MNAAATLGTVARAEAREAAEVAWRAERAERLGFALEAAAEVAAGPVDLHDVERLRDRGCPLDVALAILT